MTLVELLVTLAVLAVVLGLALTLMVESERASREMLRFDASLQYCQQAMNEAVRLVRAAAAPANIQGAAVAPALLKPRYSRKELALIVAEGDGFKRVVLDTVDMEKSQSALRRRSLPLTGAATTTQTGELSRISRPDKFEPRFRFAYAGSPTPGQHVSYIDEWTSPSAPALVRITIQARVGNHSARSGQIELQTAVIPGLIPAGTAVREATFTEPAASPEIKAIPALPAGKVKAPATSKVLDALNESKTAAAPQNTEAADKGNAPRVITAEPPARIINRAKLDRLKGEAGR